MPERAHHFSSGVPILAPVHPGGVSRTSGLPASTLRGLLDSARNDHALNLRRSFIDLGDPLIAIAALDNAGLAVATTPQNLHGIIAYAVRDFAGQEFRHRTQCPHVLTGIVSALGFVEHYPGCGQLRRGFGELEADSLMVDDG